MDESLRPNRRTAMQMLGGAALSATLGPRQTEAKDEITEFLPSSLDAKTLEKQKAAAADEIVEGFWKHQDVRKHELRYLLGNAQSAEEAREWLRGKSSMYIPDAETIARVQKTYAQQLRELAGNMNEDGTGLFLGGNEQQLYLLNRVGRTQIEFVKAYPVSTSRLEWSNEPNSRGTPLGMHWIAAMRKGMLGEVLTSAEGGTGNLVKIPLRTGKRTIYKVYVKDMESPKEPPQIITAAFHIVGPNTPASRRIFLHGATQAKLLTQGASSGCIRLANVDTYDLFKHVSTGRLKNDGRTVIGGTPVMIAATEDSDSATALGKRKGFTDEWTPEKGIEPDAEIQPKKATEPEPPAPKQKRKLRPNEWIPPHLR